MKKEVKKMIAMSNEVFFIKVETHYLLSLAESPMQVT